MDSHDLYLAHRDTLEGAIATICRRFHLPPNDAEDFAGEFRLRLVKEDYATLKQFQGRSSLRTFLHVVVTRAFQDWRNARWGKWRSSAEAKRLGPLAVQLEVLVARDRYTLDEAIEILRTNLGMNVNRAALEAMAARFPTRQGRQAVGADALDDMPAATAQPDRGIAQGEAALEAQQATDTLRHALRRLPAQDQLILRMRFDDCLAFSDIARALHLEQKPLYRRVERLLAELRAALEEHGFTHSKAMEVLAQDGFSEMPEGVRELSALGRLGSTNGPATRMGSAP